MKRIAVFAIVVVALSAVGMCGAASAGAAAKITYTGTGAKKGVFTVTAGKSRLQTVGGQVVVCQAATGKGQLAASPATTASSVVVVYKECEGPGNKCTTTGKAPGEIETKVLKMTLGDIASGAEPGALLEPESGTVVSEFKCGTSASVVEGSGVIGKLTPVGVKTKTFTLAFAEASGVQVVKLFASGTQHFLKAELNGQPLAEAGLEVSDALALEEGEGQVTA